MNEEESRPPHFRSRRFVLRTHPATSEVAQLADLLTWPTTAEVPENPALNQPRKTSWNIAEGVTLDCMENSTFEITYVATSSNYSRNLSEHISKIVEHGLDVIADPELVTSAAEATSVDQLSRTLVRAGVGAPLNLDNRYSKLFINAVRSEHPEVRMHGLIAIGFTEWGPFKELLDAVSTEDDNADVRNVAAGLAQAFEAMGIGGI